MSKAPQKPAPFPSKEEILEFLRDSPGHVGKREIARAFRLDPHQKVRLKGVLKELERDGLIQRGRGRRFGRPGTLPEVMVLEVLGPDTDGELLARPLTWEAAAKPPAIYLAPERRGRSALGKGDRVLARLRGLGDSTYQAQPIRVIAEAPRQVLGVYVTAGGEGRIRPTDRRHNAEYLVAPLDAGEATTGEVVVAEILPGRRLGLRQARVVQRLGSRIGPRSASLIAIHGHGIPDAFSRDALRLAERAGPVGIAGRDDLRGMPLVTIDGADARDFDDAVWAEPDPDPANSGGWHLVVAIADVAWYVRPGDALDHDAYERGNSTYFPDRVVPMLPEPLSNGWCSLKPGEDRGCLACHLWIDAEGRLLRHRFVRGLMRSAARLTYEQVQAARDGRPDDVTGSLLDTVITPLYGGYRALMRHRLDRGVLELDLPERRIVIGADGGIERVELRARYDSHRLIEEFMIAANVAAAETLEGRRAPCLYRVHNEPARDKLDALREFLDSIGLKLARGQVVRPRHFNQILEKAAGTPHAHLVNEVVLRSQAQAAYSPDNIGHFGLALRRYCHFTSPIRRYADLVVHRALVRALCLGEGGLEPAPRDFADMGDHLSATERRAAAAEREAVDRFAASWLAARVGAEFAGRVSGVTRFGLFVTLLDNGADGLVPMSTLPDDYYFHDEARHLLRGRRHGREYRLGDDVRVVLAEADPVTGGLVLQVAEAEAPAGRRRSGGGDGGRRGRGGRR